MMREDTDDNGTDPPQPAPRTPPPVPTRPASHGLRSFPARLRGHRASRLVVRILVALLGAVVASIGLVLVPLPGPGWLIVLAGLAIWAIEFHWARRLLHFTRTQLQRWLTWIGLQSLPVRLVVGVAGLIIVILAAWAAVWLSTGIDLVYEIRRYLSVR